MQLTFKRPDNGDAAILFRCEDYVIVYKPYGIMSESPGMPDLISEMLDIDIKSVFTVHRLDTTTEGIMLYCLTQKAAAEFSALISTGGFQKTYTAFISADESLPESGRMEDYLFFDRHKNKSYISKKDRKGAKKAVLEYVLTGKFSYREDTVTMAKIKLESGRTHQIRVQFGSRKSPLIGDGKYGSRINYKKASLFSSAIEFERKGNINQYILEDCFEL